MKYKEAQMQILTAHYANLIMEQRTLYDQLSSDQASRTKYLKNISECSILSEWLFDQDVRDFQLHARHLLTEHFHTHTSESGYRFVLTQYERPNLIKIGVAKEEGIDVEPFIHIHFLASIVPGSAKIALCKGDEDKIQAVVSMQNATMENPSQWVQVIMKQFNTYIKEFKSN